MKIKGEHSVEMEINVYTAMNTHIRQTYEYSIHLDDLAAHLYAVGS